MKKWSSDRWLSIVAIIASMGTLFTIVYQTNLIRKQQYASVLPYLEMWNSNQGHSYSYVLMNNGIGPAFIKEVKVHYNDTIYYGDPDHFAFYVIKPKDSLKNYSYSNIQRGRLIPAGERVNLISVSNDTLNAGILSSWLSHNDSVQVEIIYESVYGERWSAKGLGKEPVKLN
ncbi:MAG: hypothetical protein RIM99_18265 [Cyclobacteriaceae bacterium]